MKIKNAVLIEPRTPGINFFSFTNMPLLGLPILGAMMKKRGLNVDIFCENLSAIDWDRVNEADLVGLTALTNLAPRAYELINQIKEINPRCVVVMGGPHVSFRTEEALANGADYVIRHEGEGPFMELLNCLQEDGDPEDIRGLSFKKEGEMYHNPDQKGCPNLDQLPTPDFSLIKGAQKLKYIPIQTSRGCPHNCEFCSVVQMYGRKIRYRSPEKVVQDIHKLARSFNLEKKHVFFVDDNFSANQERAANLLEHIEALDYDLNWSTQEEVNIYKKPNILNKMVKAGCKRLHLGIESFNQASLDEYDKPQNLEDIKRAIQAIHDKGIFIHGMFVLGADSDTKESILQTARNAVKYNIDSAQFSILVPLPGTRLYENLKEKERLLVDRVKNWELFEGQHVVFKPKNLSPYDLQKLQLKATSKFYNIKNSFGWLLKKKFGNVATTLYGSWNLWKWKQKNRGFLSRLRKNYS